MEICICLDAAEVGRMSAALVAKVCREAVGDPVLGVATGSSPLGTYAELARLVAAGKLDLTRAYAFALDEYVGLPLGHPQSYAEIIRATVTEPLRMNPARVRTPNGFAADVEAAATDYERMIAASGGVDIQILGVGSNGHIGFNEPSSSLASRTRIKTLTARTRQDNARFFASLDDVPRHCLTQGLGTIMDARNVVLVAVGEGKAHAVAAVAEGPVSSMMPGSVLQMHRSATLIIDEAAASQLQLIDYYREVFALKPAWQRFDGPA